nr:hypothetical protein BaRGS_017156 [Batillaria attramentaria]
MAVVPGNAGEAAGQDCQCEQQPNVAFQAELSEAVVDLAPNEQLVFDQVVTNEGAGYNTSTGRFRAPVSGTYMFIVNFTADWKEQMYVFLKVDNASGRKMASISDGRAGSWSHATGSVILQLAAGQEVWLKRAGIPNSTVGLKGQSYSSFSGFLIRASGDA